MLATRQEIPLLREAEAIEYLFFNEPEPLARRVPLLLPIIGRFTTIVGHSFFGDLFLRDSGTREYAILVALTLELVDTGEVEERGFREQILSNPEVLRTLLRSQEVVALVRRLGAPRQAEAFIPVPLPALGGSGEVGTMQIGGLWEYLGIVAQLIGGRA
jgi:hypothetical protein